MAIAFNTAPYYDDFSEDKGFLKILFRPGYAVQARELTQSQDILQNQISRFGSYVFKSGSSVLGGMATIDTNVTYANVQPIYNNTSVNLANFANTVITDTATRTIRASVVAVIPQITGGNVPPTLMMKYLTGTIFPNGANITVETTSSNSQVFALLANTNSQGTGSIASIRDGIYFIDMNNIVASSNSSANNVPVTTNAYFVRVPAQTIVLDAYDNTPTYRIGLQVSDTIVSEQQDASLFDPALGSSNYQGPGATRYLISAILSSRTLDSIDDTAFIELMRINNGTLQSATTSSTLSVINDTLARRTYDQSGDFTVKSFSINFTDSSNSDSANANTQLYTAVLDAGKAYVKGYELETISKTVLTAPRARTTANVIAATIPTYFGNYILLDNIQGELNVSQLPQLDIHCVSTSNVAVGSAGLYANTLIGTAKIRGLEFNNASNTSNSLTYVYRAHLFDVNTTSFVATSTGATASTIQLATNFSAINDAYTGMTIQIPSTGDSRIISGYVGSTRIATIVGSWSVNPTSTQYVILGSITSASSIGLNTASSFITANANINIGSKNQSASYTPASLTDTNFQTMVFPLPNFVIAPGLQNPSYEYKYRIATGQTLSAGAPLTINLSIPGDSSASFAAPGISGSDLISLENFMLVSNNSTSNRIVPMTSALGRNIATTPTTATFTMAPTDSTLTNIDIFASVKTNIGPKTKTFVTGNTATLGVTGGTTISGSIIYLNLGQINFPTPQTSHLPLNKAESLHISDVINIVCIVDSGAANTTVSLAMIQAAANNTTMPGSSINVTKNYAFYNGQKDSYYDHATITLLPGAAAPRGQITVVVNYFSHSTTGGYFTVDSYANYATIPIYQPTTGGSLNLRDCVDFRPRRDDLTSAYTFNNSGIIVLPEPFPNTGFNIDFAYYLGRVDRIILSPGGQFSIIQGASSLAPTPPPISKSAMLLYTLTIPPYTFYSANIVPQLYNNKRYTMRDIGTLEKRIQTLEYYTTLNQLEQSATNQNITDSNGLTVPKNGILTDNFQGSSVADVLNKDYFAAIDTQNQQCRPAFNIKNVTLHLQGSLSGHYNQKGRILTLPYSVTSFIEQTSASRTENLNPFNLTVWNGTLKLDPESDTWVETNQLPDLVTNLTGDNDGWTTPNSYSIAWNSWQTVWAGVDSTTSTYTSPTYLGGQAQGVYVDAQHANGGWSAYQLLDNTVTTTTSQTVENQVRTGIATSVSYDNITKEIGTRLVNVSVIPYLRQKYVIFRALSMKPLTTIYPWFDNVNVVNYTNAPNIMTFTNNVNFQDTYGAAEFIFDSTNNNNRARVIMVKGNQVYVDFTTGVLNSGATFVGQRSGASGILVRYDHRSGFSGEPKGLSSQGNPSILLTTTSIVLQGAASNTTGYYTGNTIYITQGVNAGQSVQITAYDGPTRTATISPNISIVPFTNTNGFYYSIGPLVTDTNGDISGSFIVPDPITNNIKFPTGTSVFCLNDSNTNNLQIAATKAQDSYVAQGTLDTTQTDYVTTAVPVITTTTVQQSQTVTSDPSVSTVSSTNVVEYIDPLAQSFLVDNTVYPNGVFITSVRVCFYSKDNNIPVTLQIRPMVNGFPSASQILPFSQVALNPSNINVATAPSLDDPTQYTEFTFDSPLCLLPGTEYAIVLISNSNNYNIFSALVGDKLLGSDRLISQPPYLGLLFKSQNSSTWTPSQGESLVFRIMKAVFDTSAPMTITLSSPAYSNTSPIVNMPNNEIYMDVMYLTTSDALPANCTTLQYGYRATSNTSRTLDATYSPIVTKTNFSFFNREVLAPAGNSFYLQASGSSTSVDVSPIIDTERYSILTVANQVDNGSLSNNDITINQQGAGWNISNTNIVTISGGNGSGAQLALQTVSGGNVISVMVAPNGGGSGYTSSINASISAVGYSPTQPALITIASETNPSGGPFTSRYITRMVTLAEGMDSNNLLVSFNAYKPIGSQIYVYYKVMSAEDNDVFANKNYVLMSLDETDSFAASPSQFKSYTYVPNIDQYGNPINNITYSTFDSFKYFAVKIVFAATNPANPPIISGLTVTATPAYA